MEHITIIGAGGIGCALGHALSAAGQRITMVDTDDAKVHFGRQHGVGIDGFPSQPAHFERFANWQPDPNSLILLCTKCYDNAAVRTRLTGEAMLLPVQNGFDPDQDARVGGLEGIASFISECHPHEPQTCITRPGKLHLGFRGGVNEKDRALLAELALLLSRHGQFGLRVVADIRPFKYTKLMYNAAISPIAAAGGLDNGSLLSYQPARQLFFDLLAENYQILHGAGVKLEKIGLFHPDTVQRILAHRFVAHALAWAFYPSLRRTYCSMSGDLPRGRTEIDFYNRHLIELAGDRPCPLNRRVYALVKRMEHERTPPGPAVLHELAA